MLRADSLKEAQSARGLPPRKAGSRFSDWTRVYIYFVRATSVQWAKVPARTAPSRGLRPNRTASQAARRLFLRPAPRHPLAVSPTSFFFRLVSFCFYFLADKTFSSLRSHHFLCVSVCLLNKTRHACKRIKKQCILVVMP